MSIIKGSDIVDFDGVARELAKSEADFIKYGTGVISVIQKIDASIESQIERLKKLESATKSINLKSPGAGSSLGINASEVDKAISSIERYKATIESMKDSSRLHELSISQLKSGIAALKTQYDNLDPTAKEFKDSQAQIANQVKLATQAVNAQSAVMKVAVKAVNDVNNTYNKLSKETAELKNQLRSLPGAFNLATGEINKHNAAAVMLQKQINLNDQALKKMDASMGNYQRNVGNYKSAVSGLGLSLTGIIAPVLGVASAYEALSASVRVIDQLSRLKLGLEAVSSSSDQTIKRFKFLSDLADSTGQDISKLADNYIQFAGATKNTSLEGAKGDAIFKSFSNTFSALGKSSDVANRGLYAIQQMISKTKVNSEELNQQLAEALPGANKLFADALGVSTAKLADMLKKGEVLALDVLPKVAAQLEKTYGDRAQKNVETISGSFARLTTQFKLFLDGLNKDNAISKFFSGINNGIANSFKALNSLRTDFGEVEKRVQSIRDSRGAFENNFKAGIIGTTQDYLDAARQVSSESEKINKSLGLFNSVSDPKKRVDIIIKEQDDLRKLKKEYDIHIQQGKDILFFTDERKKKTQQLSQAINEQQRLVSSLSEAERKRFSTPKEKQIIDPVASGDSPDSGGATKRQLTQYQKLIESAEKLRGILIDDILGDAKAGRPLEVSDEALAKWNKLYDVIRQVANATGDQIPANLRELNDKLTKAPQDIANQIPIESISAADSSTSGKAPQMDSVVDLTKYNALLGVHEKEIENLQNRLINGSFKKFSDEYAVQLESQLKEIQSLEKEAALAQTDQERQAVNERIALAKQEYDEKVRLAREEIAIKRELQEQLVNLAMESVGAVFQIGSDQREADLDSLQASLDHELSLVQGNEEAQARIKKDYAKKELEIRQKQAKAEKAQAIFSIAINTIKAIAAANAVGPPANIAFMAIAAAIGAIQLATAIAKPIPQFYKGTKSAPEGYAQVAEKGAEIRESDGKMMIYDKPGVAYLKKGDKIYTAQETKAMLERSESNGKINTILSRTSAGQKTRGEILSSQAAITALSVSSGINYNKLSDILFKAVEGKPVLQTIIDENGMRKRHIGKNGTTTYLDKRFSLNK